MWGKYMRMGVEGRRRKGRPKRRWMDSVNVVSRMKGLDCWIKMPQYWAVWRNLVRYIEVGKDTAEEEMVARQYNYIHILIQDTDE